MLADMQVLVRQIRRMAGPNRYTNLTDRVLLSCFAREGNQEAFAALVNRHALLVAGVCRRVLSNNHDVEDVFQNTFLTLARKAGTVGWQDSVANWLHGVAHRLALRSRADTLRRQVMHEAARETMAARGIDEQTRELQLVLDTELGGLGERHRLPLVLCYLEGRTRDEAARQCGWSLRTLERRLEQGRSLLRKRCLRHGLDLSVVLMAAAMADQQASARTLLVAKALGAVRSAASAGTHGGAVALKAARTATLAAPGYLKLAGGLALLLTVAAFGTYAWSGHVSAESTLATEPNIPAVPRDEPKDKPVKILQPISEPQAFGMPQARLGNAEFRASGVSKVQYSADGSHLITVGSEGLQVFDAATGRLLLRATLAKPAVSPSVSISGDGKMAVLADPNETNGGGVYDTSTGRIICRLQIPAKRAKRLASFSRDNRLLAVLVSEMSVDLYDTATGKLVRTIEWKENFPPGDGQDHLGEVGFLPDGKSMIVSVHVSGVIRVFDVTTGQETRQIPVSPKGMAGMVVSPDGQKLVALVNVDKPQRVSRFMEKPDETALLLDSATGKRLGELLIPRVSPSMFLIGPDNKTLFAGGSRTARTGIGRWNLEAGTYLDSVALPWPHPSNMPMAVSPNGKTLLCYCDSTLHQIDILTGRPPVVSGQQGAINCLSASSTLIATGSEDGKVFLWDRSTGMFVFELGEPARAVRKLLFGNDGATLFVLYAMRNVQFDDANLRAYRVSDGKMLWQVHPSQRDRLIEGTACLALNGNHLAVLNSHTITFLQAETGRVVRTDPLIINSSRGDFGQGPEMPAMIYSKQRGELLIWNKGDLHRGAWLPDQKLNGPLPMQMLPFVFPSSDSTAKSSAAFSPDGNLLALPVREHGIYLQEMTPGKKPKVLKNSPRVPIGVLAFSPNSKELAWVAKKGKAIYLADVSTGNLINTFPVFGSTATALAFAEDGKSLIVGCDDSTTHIWGLTKLPAVK